MPKFDGFIGPAYEAGTLRQDAQRLENLYIEPNESKTSSDAAALVGTPGLRLRATLPVARFRGFFAGDNRLFAVVANKLYEILHWYGTITTDGTLIAWNAGRFFDKTLEGQQLEISGITYTVDTVTDSRNLVLTEGAGTQRGVAWTGPTTWKFLGDVDDDVDHSRAEIFADGNVIFITSAGHGYIHDGVNLYKALLSNGTGKVTTSGTAVTLEPGDGNGNTFDDSLIGNPFFIGDTEYTVVSVTDARHLVLDQDAGTLGHEPFLLTPILSGTVTTLFKISGTVTATGTAVEKASGDDFDPALVGRTIYIAGAPYTVADVADTSHLTLAAPVPPSSFSGAVDVVGSSATRDSGDAFDPSMIGATITISGTAYIVLSVEDGDHLTLDSAGADGTTAGSYSVTLDATPAFTATLPPVDKTVTWESGDQFDALMEGQLFWIANIPYTVSTVTDERHLKLTDQPPELEGAYFRTSFPPLSGTADVDGTTVTQYDGDLFNATPRAVGAEFSIGGKAYTVVSVADDGSTLELDEDAGTIDKPIYRAYTWLPARMGAYIDTKFLAHPDDTNEFYVGPPNGLDQITNPATGRRFFDAGDIGTKDSGPDRLLAMHSDHNQLWLFGFKTTEVWGDSGNGAANGFQRSEVIEKGIIAPWSVVSAADGVGWLTADEMGAGQAVLARGYQPQRVSTFAVESQWKKYGTLSDAESYSYQEDGHTFWVIHFPSANATWVLDLTTGEWAKRSALILINSGVVSVSGATVTWVSGDKFRARMLNEPFYIDGVEYTVVGYTDDQHMTLDRTATITSKPYESYNRGWQSNRRVHAYAFGKHWVGDGESGNLYEQSVDFLHDDGVPIERTRTAPHLTNEQGEIFYHKFQLDQQVGEGAPNYTDLKIDASDNHSMTSVLNPFTLDDKGMWLTVTGGTGFTHQRIKIVDVVGNVAQCDRALGSTGSTAGQATPDKPLMKLSYSKNSGKTYTAREELSAGQVPNEDLMRVIWRRFPCARNMTFQVTSKARIRHGWVGAILDSTPGTA